MLKQNISVFTVTGNGVNMTRVRPAAEVQDASTSKFHTKGIEALVTMAARLFGIVSRKLERRPSTSSSDESIETGMAPNVNLPSYTQSSTRKLAFGTATEAHKPLNDFYNNSTLTNISKLFCAVVLLTAFLLVMSRSLQFAYETPAPAATRTANPISTVSNSSDPFLPDDPVN